ncbi:MAG: hypothetical protein H8E31_04660 [Planctomycetes bacterium]|nr:hypothetical protein [Planctomycetota bacterium]
MFLAGIDEAGYGPLLGPMVVGWSLFRVPEADTDLWPVTAHSASPKPARRPRQERRVWVDDSKKVHAGPHGRARLERSVAAFRELNAPGASSLEGWIHEPPAPASRSLQRAPWFRTLVGPLTPHADPVRARLDAGLLRRDLEQGGCAADGFGARAVPAAEWNDLTRELGKGDALFRVVMEVFQHLLRHTGTAPLRIECDRHGARMRYGERLRRALGPDRLEVHTELPSWSLYTLEFGPKRVEVRFAENADGLRFPVALGSLAAKLTRERLMDLWNDWFAERLPGVRPTKGYALDAKRWLAEAETDLPRLGVDQEILRRRR